MESPISKRRILRDAGLYRHQAAWAVTPGSVPEHGLHDPFASQAPRPRSRGRQQGSSSAPSHGTHPAKHPSGVWSGVRGAEHPLPPQPGARGGSQAGGPNSFAHPCLFSTPTPSLLCLGCSAPQGTDALGAEEHPKPRHLPACCIHQPQNTCGLFLFFFFLLLPPRVYLCLIVMRQLRCACEITLIRQNTAAPFRGTR